MNASLYATWWLGFGRAYMAAIAFVILALIFHLLGAELNAILPALSAALWDAVAAFIVATVVGALSPLIAQVWAAIAPAGNAVFRAGAKVPWPWIIFAISVFYFIMPLVATFQFALTIHRWPLSFDAFTNVFQQPVFQQTLTHSFLVGVAAIVVGLVIVVPAAYFVRLRAPQLRPIIEFVTLLPLIIPPIILVFGYIRLYSSSSWLPLTTTDLGTNVLLTLAYVALAMPYMYRAVDTGLRTIDVQTLTEAANILGANTPTILLQIIFPNIIVAVLSGAFLTLAIVIGEFTVASLLNVQVFGVYMQNVGANRAFEPAALAVISFVITWAAMGMIQLLARFAPKTAARS